MGGGALDLEDGRWQPSEVDVATSWREVIEREDRLRTVASLNKFPGGKTQFDKYVQPPPVPPTRSQMLTFATEGADWRAALKDPAAAAAMRRVRDRVASLQAEGRAAVQQGMPVPESALVGTRLLNARQPAPHMFQTSHLNPLSATGVERGWDPRVRLWTGRRMHTFGMDPETTSFWCHSWGASASHKGLDTDFVYVRPGHRREAYDKALHSKGWR